MRVMAKASAVELQDRPKARRRATTRSRPIHRRRTRTAPQRTSNAPSGARHSWRRQILGAIVLAGARRLRRTYEITASMTNIATGGHSNGTSAAGPHSPARLLSVDQWRWGRRRDAFLAARRTRGVSGSRDELRGSLPARKRKAESQVGGASIDSARKCGGPVDSARIVNRSHSALADDDGRRR